LLEDFGVALADMETELVRLEGIDTTAKDAPVLLLGGLDLLDGLIAGQRAD